MDATTLLAAALAVCAAGLAVALALTWRRLERAEREARALRRELALRQALPQSLHWTFTGAHPPPLSAPDSPDAPVADDPFEPGWVRTPAKPALRRIVAAAATFPTETGVGPLFPPLGDAPAAAGAGVRPPWPALIGCAALAAPALGFLAPATQAAPALAVCAVVALLIASAIRRDPRLGWLALGGAIVWPWAWSRLEGALGVDAFATPAFLSGMGLCALALLLSPWRGMAAALVALTALIWTFFGYAAQPGGANVEGLAFAALAAAYGLAGGIKLRAEGLHVAAWVLGCAGLAILAGEPRDAVVWMAPAAALFSALFFGLALLQWPDRRHRAGVLAATGATAPLLAAGAMQLSGQWAFIHPVAPATAFAFAGLAALGLTAATAARAPLRDAGWTALPPIAAAGLGLGLAALHALPLAFATPAIAALAALALAAEDRASHMAWRAAAIGLGAWSALLGLEALRFAFVATGPNALQLMVFGVAAPAGAAGVCALLAERQGRTASAAFFETLAWVGGGLAGLGVIRWLATDGAPGQAFTTFAEGGGAAAFLFFIAAACVQRGDRGARPLRAGLALTAFGVGAACFIAGPALAANPWWGAAPSPVRGAVIFDSLAPGYLAPAFAAAALASRWHARGAITRTRLSAGLAVAALSLWLVLETRHILRGPDISIAASAGESALISLYGVCAAAFLLRLPRTLLLQSLAALLAFGLCAKIGALDMNAPISLAFALSTLGLGLLAWPYAKRFIGPAPAST